MFYKNKNLKLHIPKSFEQHKNTFKGFQRAIFLRTLSNIWFEPLIWSNVQRLPQS